MGKKKSAPTAPPGVRAPRVPQTPADAPVKKASPGARVKSRRSSRKSQPQPTTAAERAAGPPPGNPSFLVVGIGASAGGLEAFTQLLGHLPADTGMAFVLIQHLDPTHKSLLTELLARATPMPVREVTDGLSVQPDHVYVIPPNTTMTISQRVLKLSPRTETRGPHRPIDDFLRSLAEDQRSQAIGVILSGTASDGTLGLKAIKAEGGITFVQDEKSAKYDSMPHSAIMADAIDFILPPEGIARELGRIGRHPYVTSSPAAKTAELAPQGEEDLHQIFRLLRTATGVDFTYYKHTTIQRRIQRRMVLHKLERPEDYVRYLQDHSAEVEALYQEILIPVTDFFRNPETFQALKNKVFPDLIKNRSPEDPIRVWVPGCSTGEEAYSLAIGWLEFLADTAPNIPIQIFGTDLSETALGKARAGLYMENLTLSVSPERLRRFFVKVDHGYQISKRIRERCIFAKHNVTQDPPFSRMDLISCRNMLIYLGSVLQKKVIPILHYALKPTGFLLLGTSETVGTASALFAPIDKKHKIYLKKSAPVRRHFNFAAGDSALEKADLGRKTSSEDSGSGLYLQKEADRMIMSKYSLAGFIINEALEILQFRGQTGPYLEPAPGEVSFNLLKMVREDLRLELRTAIHKAQKGEVPVKKEGLRVTDHDRFREVRLEVIPIKAPSSKERGFLVLLEDVTPPAPSESKETPPSAVKPGAPPPEADDPALSQLQLELSTTKKYLQSIIEEQDATNQELQAANEEILSSNEELQSINEELETAKEEVQAANEELTTVNEELQNRNLELGQANEALKEARDYAEAIVETVREPLVVLNADLRVQTANRSFYQTFQVSPEETEQQFLYELGNGQWNIPALRVLLEEILPKNTPFWDFEVDHAFTHIGPKAMRLNARRIRGADDRTQRILLAIEDITEHKRADEALQESEERYALAARGANDGLWDWNLKTNAVYFSPRWKSMLGCEESEIGNSPDEWFNRVHLEDIARVKADIASHLEALTDHVETEYRMRHRDGTYRWMLSRGLAARDAAGKAYRMAGSMSDSTERKRAEEQLLHAALYDALTGLPNRAVFIDRTGHAINLAKRRGDYFFAMLFLDLDHFKVVNDSLGHTIGDQLLMEIARRLAPCVRPADTVARLGGDEFAVLLDDIKDVSDATRVAERIQKELTWPFHLSGHEVFTTASIGIALSATGYDRPEDLLRDADMAMYRAKTLGRARYVMFDTGMHDRAVALLQLEADLRRAVERQEFQLYYQPIVSLASGQITGVEALVRWHHPQRGLVYPAEFIPVEEETELIITIGEWVLRAACAQNQAWQAAGYSPLRMAVNLPARQFQQQNLPELIKKVLKETGMTAQSLALEITEGTAMQNIGFNRATLNELSTMGIQILIDDFGTGYSSLGYLKHFPIHSLKIDQSFIRDMTSNSDDAAITTAIIAMAHSLKLKVIAEGVETEEQLVFLRSHQCDEMQGYLFSRPVPAEAFTKLLQEKRCLSIEPGINKSA